MAPPTPLRAATPLEDTTLGGGKWAVEKDSTKVWCNIYMVHRDPAVWGPDVSGNLFSQDIRVLNHFVCERLMSLDLSVCSMGNLRLFR
jgi:hypothetical protein